MFQISECKEKDRVKFAMATLYGRALTWWTERTKAIGIKAANNTPWSEVIEEVVVIIDERKTAVRTRGEVLENEENATLRNKLAEKDVLLDLTRIERDRAERRGTRPTVLELTGYTYATFIKCDPLPFNGTEGMV
nr:hypothetical protein [Tanacetum cinerariifolium]